MLPPPEDLKHRPEYDVLLRMCASVLLTVEEVAKHFRYQVPHVHNMRNRGRGPAHLKLEGGAIRYPLSEVLRWQLHGYRGPWTPERVTVALATMPEISPELRAQIMTRLHTLLDVEEAAP